MILDDLVAATTARIQREKKLISLAALQQQVAEVRPVDKPSFIASLDDHFGIIAEVKKASPSKGLIAKDFPFLGIAREYTKAGVDAISVLTEPDYFKGDLEFMHEIAQVTSKPVLRKDFVIDPYMIYQAKIHGASLVLLIVAILSDQQLHDYYQLATELGLEVLVECHDETEIKRALAVHPQLIGVNNRDLRDFTVDIHHSEQLRAIIPADIKVLAESGITQAAQLKELKQHGLNGVLIGETFMRAPDREAIIKQYKEAVL